MSRVSYILAFLLLVAGPAAADPGAFPPPGRFDYAVMRLGERIGTHTVEFRRDGGSLTVATRIDIEVTWLGLTLFAFHHQAQEDWRDGRMVAFRSKTDDDGEARAVSATADGGHLAIVYNGQQREAPADILPASLWHPGTTTATQLFDPVKGKVRQVTVTDDGSEPVEVRGAPLEAHRFSIAGDLRREVWYGPDGQVVKVRFPSKDGSWVTLVLQ
jgi:hypothetical protein